MNLAVEYIIRSGTARDCFEVPCSLYLNHLERNNQHLVVTINWHPFSKKYLIKQWFLSEYRCADLLPSFQEYSITDEEMFESNKTIVPMYELLPFKESPYKSGIWQRGHGEQARRQEANYQDTLNDFLYPSHQKNMRLCWLWSHFARYHRSFIESAITYNKVEDQMWVTEREYKPIWKKWTQWLRYFYFETEVAPELVFHNAYKAKTRKESEQILKDNSNWNINVFYPPQGHNYHRLYIPQIHNNNKTNKRLWPLVYHTATPNDGYYATSINSDTTAWDNL